MFKNRTSCFIRTMIMKRRTNCKLCIALPASLLLCYFKGVKNITFFNTKPKGLALSGKLLVADFQSAIASLVTMETAKYQAEQAEQATLQTIQTANSPNNGIFVTPHDIPATSQDALVRSSLDAHLKKVQSEQISKYTLAQIAQLQEEDKHKYTGKKVQITVLNREIGAVESYWYNNQTGRYSQGIMKANSVKGTIEELSFSKNLLIIKPLLASRIVLSARKYFLVSVINPETLEPLVDISIL